MPEASPPAASITGPEARNKTRSPAGPALRRTPRIFTGNSEIVVPMTTVFPTPVIPAWSCDTGMKRAAAPSGGVRSNAAATPAPTHRATPLALPITPPASLTFARRMPRPDHARRAGVSPLGLLYHHRDLKSPQHDPIGRQRGRGGRLK